LLTLRIIFAASRATPPGHRQRDPLLLGEPGELLVLVIIDVLRCAPVLATVPVELLGEVVLL